MGRNMKSEDLGEEAARRERLDTLGVRNVDAAKVGVVVQGLTDLKGNLEKLAKGAADRGAKRAATQLNHDADFIAEFVLPEYTTVQLAMPELAERGTLEDAIRAKIVGTIDRGITLKLSSQQIADTLSQGLAGVLRNAAAVSYIAGEYAREHQAEAVIMKALDRATFGDKPE